MSVEFCPTPIDPAHYSPRPAFDIALDLGVDNMRMLHVRDEDDRAEWGSWLWEHSHRIVYEGDAAELVGRAEYVITMALRIGQHTIEHEDPLTVSPSLLCSCGKHGFVRNGLWVEA